MIFKSYLVDQNINLLDKKLCLLFGENLGLKIELKNKIINKNKNAEFIRLTQDEILKNEDNFFNEIYNISLFEKQKIYLIDQTSDKILNIIKELQPKLDTQKIYLFSDVLDRRSKLRSYFEKSHDTAVVICYADNELTIKKIVIEKLKGYSGLSPQNIITIVNNSNLDRIKLNNELNKITTYFQNKIIDAKKLEILLDLKVNNDFNILKDQALEGNKNITNKLLSETLIESEKNILYLNQINQRINKLSQIFELTKTMTLDNAMNTIKPPIFWKEKQTFGNQAKKWTSSKIKEVLKKTYNFELSIKTNSSIDKNVLIKKLMIDICNLANAS